MAVPLDNRPPSRPPVPSWVAYVTFLLCWGTGVVLLTVIGPKAGDAAKYVLVAGFLLLVFPLASFEGLLPALVKAITKRIGGGQ